MILQRGIDLEKLVLVRHPKPCKASLKVGDYVKLNGISGGKGVRVVRIVGDEVTCESRDWRGIPEKIEFPRICLRKARFSTLLHGVSEYIQFLKFVRRG
jgi:hypothetical protein